MDDCIELELPYKFDFDQGRRYYYEVLPKDLLNSLQSSQFKFSIFSSINTSHLTTYNMISKCPIPPLLSSADGKALSFQKMEETLFSENYNNGQLVQNFKELTKYKLCMIQEFMKDDDIKKPELIFQSQEFKVYHKMYRKNLESKQNTIIQIEAPSLIETFLNRKDSDAQTQIQLELLCLYINKHVSLYFSEEFIKGFEFDCNVSNYNMVLEFKGFKNGLLEFQEKVINTIISLQNSDQFKSTIIENLKKKIYNKYSNFEEISSLDLSLYYLKSVLDKQFIDYSSEEKRVSIVNMINRTNESDLSLLLQEICN